MQLLLRVHKDKLRRARMINVGSDFLKVNTYALCVGQNMRQTIGPVSCTQILIVNWQNKKKIISINCL